MSEKNEHDGIALIAQERRRQIVNEGYDPQHDSEHVDGELVEAAICYAMVASAQARGGRAEEWEASMMVCGEAGATWPWEEDTWKPSDNPIRNLQRAGALITAEIDRRLREGEKP